MSIKGLTDIATLEGKGFPLIARLYKGAPKETRTNKDGKEYEVMGKDLDYFRVEFEAGYEHLAPIWQELYGDKPDTFNNVQLTKDTTEMAFATWNEEWNGSGTMLKRCDGEKIVTLWMQDAGRYMDNANLKCANDGTHTCGCKKVGRLAIMLPDLLEASGVVGEILVTTHSVNDIIHVSRYLYNLEKAIGGGELRGGLMGIPFTFGRGAHEISAPKTAKQADGSYKATGTRMIVNKSLFYLYAEPEFVKQVILPRHRETAQLRAQAVAQLPAVTTPILPPVTTMKTVQNLGTGDRTMRIIGRDPEQTEITPVKRSDETVIEQPTTIIMDGTAALNVDTDTGEIIEIVQKPTAPKISWDVDKPLMRLTEECRKALKISDVQLSDLGRLVGLASPGVLLAWTGAYPTLTDAVNAAVAAQLKQFDFEQA